VLVAQLLEAQNDASREEKHEEMEIHEEGRPSSGLVLGYGSNDWNIPD
jgi:hypothetical protein